MSTEKVPSILTTRGLPSIYKEIQDVYLRSPQPWVVGYSGGKDSTTVLQLIWNAIARLPPDRRTKHIYVISTDTLVETPMIVHYIDDTLSRINATAQREEMPFSAHKLTPVLDDSFWVNLIGRGYPAPTSIFRWCTDRLKINPSNRFILEKVAEHGEVILALGMRRGESNARDQVMNLHQVRGFNLARHGQLAGAWVYMPIEQFTADDVWTYLLSVPSPWGNDNRQLSALYKSAQSGECPLVVDRTTSSCGNSRFGCWVCTVVSRDRSMEAMIDSGEEWMIPLLEFRDWLASTQDPEVKPLQREYVGRDGKAIVRNGKLRWRTYKLRFSREMLRRLLVAQKAIHEHDPNFELINELELREIRRIWVAERQDWPDSVPQIFREEMGHDLDWEQNDVVHPGTLEMELLEELAPEEKVNVRLVQKLLDAEWQHYGMRRRATIHDSIDRILGEDWRGLEEILEAEGISLDMMEDDLSEEELNSPSGQLLLVEDSSV